jgi:hypothetical protein
MCIVSHFLGFVFFILVLCIGLTLYVKWVLASYITFSNLEVRKGNIRINLMIGIRPPKKAPSYPEIEL